MRSQQTKEFNWNPIWIESIVPNPFVALERFPIDLSKGRKAFVDRQQKIVALFPAGKPVHFCTPQPVLKTREQLEFVNGA